MNNIGIFGIGAIGSLLMKYLLRNETNNCLFFNRSVRKEISIKFNEREDRYSIKLASMHNQNLNWLIVCLKEYHLANAIPNLRALINKTTKIAIFQNGINLSSGYSNLTTKENILETIIDCPIQKLGDHQYLQFKKPTITLPDNNFSFEFIQLFRESEIDFITTSEFINSQWTKLIESSAIGAIQSYTGKPCIVFRESKYVNEYVELVKEGFDVAESEGVKLNSDLIDELLVKLKRYPDNKGSSMLSDRLAGNELELNAKIGAIIKIAAKNKVNIPTTARIYKMLVN